MIRNTDLLKTLIKHMNDQLMVSSISTWSRQISEHMFYGVKGGLSKQASHTIGGSKHPTMGLKLFLKEHSSICIFKTNNIFHHKRLVHLYFDYMTFFLNGQKISHSCKRSFLMKKDGNPTLFFKNSSQFFIDVVKIDQVFDPYHNNSILSREDKHV